MGIPINGQLISVPGLHIVPPAGFGGPDWCTLGPEDGRQRPTSWVRQLMPHTTGGKWPQLVRPGAAPGGHARIVADMWRGKDGGGGERVYSGAHADIDFDGAIYFFADLARVTAFHGEGSNPWSIGIEMSTHPDGSIQGATLDAFVGLAAALTWSGIGPVNGLFSIPFQMERGPYRNKPLARMETGAGKLISRGGTRDNTGGPNVVGILGHRDNTSERGRGDPGDEVWKRLAAVACEGLDYHGDEDLLVGKERQAALNARGARLTVDGVFGPASATAMQRFGFRRWRDVT